MSDLDNNKERQEESEHTFDSIEKISERARLQKDIDDATRRLAKLRGQINERNQSVKRANYITIRNFILVMSGFACIAFLIYLAKQYGNSVLDPVSVVAWLLLIPLLVWLYFSDSY